MAGDTVSAPDEKPERLGDPLTSRSAHPADPKDGDAQEREGCRHAGME
jgi:hypothetical protein